MTLFARFIINMRRIVVLVGLVVSGKLDRTVTGQYQGASADILRFVVVFLHATFEDVLRTHIPKSGKN